MHDLVTKCDIRFTDPLKEIICARLRACRQKERIHSKLNVKYEQTRDVNPSLIKIDLNHKIFRFNDMDQS